jgi:aminobenzoyl-glutamate utilization protein B
MSKETLFSLVDQNQEEMKDMAKCIWNYAEGPYKEEKSSKLQREYLEKQGFKIIDVPNIKTAFIAEYGEGKPILAILGEYDALPGMAQKVSSKRETIEGEAYGHGCGHNLLGTGGVGAAAALKEMMAQENLKGTLRYYGCPAEELLSGKVHMAREKVFDDIDACVSWHPASMNVVWGCSHLAMNSMKFRFKGVSAHAAAAPQAGRSALDAVELMNVGANYLREHVIEKARIHYIITNGGMAPNIVPEDAEVWYYVRAPKRSEVREISQRLHKIAEGAAMMTETKMSYELVAGCYDVLANPVLGKLMHNNMLQAGGPKFSPEDYEFAKELSSLTSREDKKKVMATYFAPDYVLDKVLCEEVIELNDSDLVLAGSVDGGDVSYITPYSHVTTATWPVGTAAHSWIATAASGSGIGLNAMIFASKAMAGTVYDMLKDNSLVEEARAEFKRSLNGFQYVSPFEE